MIQNCKNINTKIIMLIKNKMNFYDKNLFTIYQKEIKLVKMYFMGKDGKNAVKSIAKI